MNCKVEKTQTDIITGRSVTGLLEVLECQRSGERQISGYNCIQEEYWIETEGMGSSTIQSRSYLGYGACCL